jgi:hypothetical protein
VADGAYVSVSTDGVAWTLVPGLTTNRFLLAVAWGAGTFVVVGNNGRILTSPDGFNWTFWPSGTDATLNTVAYGNGTFVAAGSPGNILRSRDAFIWYAAPNPVSTRIDKLVYAGGRFVGLAGAEGFISSSDAMTWNVHPTPVGSALRDLTFCEHAVTAIGQNGVVATTAFFGPPILAIDRSNQLQLRGEMWGVYHLQRATNVAAEAWTDALVVTNLTSSIPLTDPTPGLAPRFYRAVSP